MTERSTVARVAARLAIYWPSFEVTESWTIGAADLFDGIDPDDLEEAVRMLAETGREFPPPVGLIAKTARPLVPPYHGDLPAIESGVDSDPEATAAAIAETRARLRALPSIKRIGEAS